jgi:hypothetical protein
LRDHVEQKVDDPDVEEYGEDEAPRLVWSSRGEAAVSADVLDGA